MVAAAIGVLAPTLSSSPALAADRIENLVTTNTRNTFTSVIAQGGRGAVATLTDEKSYSHTVSGSIGISVKAVSASLDYSYGEVEKVTYAYSIEAPLRTLCYRVTATDRWRRDSFKWIKDIRWAPDVSGKATTRDHLGVSYNNDDWSRPPWGC
jgi:hypothetical protein